MAFTLTPTARVKNQPQRFGQVNTAIYDCDFATVASGGDAVTAADFGFGTALLGVTCIAVTDGADEVSDVTFDAENSKLLPVDEAGAYVSGDLSGASVRLLAWGI